MIGQRKFLICGGALVMGFVGLLLARLTGGDFVTLATVAVGAFAAGNAVEHYAKGAKT